MYFIRKIRKTKKRTSKSSFIVSLPKKLQRKIESQNSEISKRLEIFTRFRYFYDGMEGSKCFLLSLWGNELPSQSEKTTTTTIQRSGRTSRYVLLPKKVCYKYGWTAGTELVIGLDFSMDKFAHDIIYENNVTNNEQPQVCVIKFQRYQNMKKIYRMRLEKKKKELARQESDACWASRTNYRFYEIIDKIQKIRKQVHQIVWNKLFETNLVVISYGDFVKLRSEMEREKKRKRRQFLQKRYGIRATWRYRKDLVRPDRRHGFDYDAYNENKLDDPDSYHENISDDPDSYYKNKLDNPND